MEDLAHVEDRGDDAKADDRHQQRQALRQDPQADHEQEGDGHGCDDQTRGLGVDAEDALATPLGRAVSRALAARRLPAALRSLLAAAWRFALAGVGIGEHNDADPSAALLVARLVAL